MTDKINDQISAFVDDELSEQECAFLVRRFEHDTLARGQAVRYTMIGSALRNELLRPDPAILLRRISSALDGASAPAVQAATAASPRGPHWSARVVRPLAGLAIAAGVASIAILGLRQINETPEPAGPAAVAAETADVVEPPSYVVPRDVAEGHPVTPTIRLTNYLVHHGEYASGLNRTSVHSNVVTAPEMLLDEAAAEKADADAAKVVLE
ncbi:MAG TPA: sigma-E factor negative regulatory protein [Gammaproteobacteria bacterium]|nr:sigma-E factor negative regulatory protein [Gammaproteobacteria bacterium]